MMGEGGSTTVDPILNKLSVDAFNILPISPNPFWEQWCSMDQRAFTQSAEEGNLVSAYRQSKFVFDDSLPTSPTSSLDHCSDPYPAATFTATPSVFQMPYSQTSHQLGIPSLPLTAKREERQKRKRCSNKNSARKSLRRNPERESNANTATREGGTGRSNRSCGTHGHHGSEHSGQQDKNHSQHTKERNRIASGKFRAKKREHMLRVQSEEQELERTNYDLSIGVANLTREVQELKMKLLQHTDCDCSLIHDYLAVEAQRYVCGLSMQSQFKTTSPGAACN